MLNLNELENRWFRYKVKSYIPHAIIILFALLLTIILVFNYSNETKKQKPKQKIEKIEKTEIKSKISNEKIEKTDTKLILSPSLSFINTIKNTPKQNNIHPTIKKEIISPKIEEIITVPIITKDNTITIDTRDNKQNLQLIIQRFKTSNNPTLSLFIARQYYKQGNYEGAYNYALMTNEISNKIEESWIIFAKSLYKLGKKEKSIKVLNSYISGSNSNRAKILLNSINSGKLK